MKSSVTDLIRRSHELDAVSDTPRLDVEVLLCHLLEKERTFLFTWPDHRLTDSQLQTFEALFERRKKGEPVAHITGVREFWSLPLEVNSSTLIPRPDTELLVETALNLTLPAHSRVVDLGAGTGAIALALASEKPAWKIVACDLMSDAVNLAERNRIRLGLENVKVLQSDWFSALDSNDKFDLIVSNPPYIDPEDPHLTQGDVRFEPLSALTAEEKGLADIKMICAQAPLYLNDKGWLMVEHGYDQGTSVRAVFEKNGFLKVSTQKDLGCQDRVTYGQFCP